MTDQELLNRQDQLQHQGQQLLNDLQLVALLSSYGAVDIGGSFSLGLMTWPDIDIGLIVPTINLDDCWSIARCISTKAQTQHLSITDNVSGQRTHRPTGFYIGPKVDDNNGLRWKIDLWVVTKLQENIWDKGRIKDINTHQRLAILKIKQIIMDHPGYTKDVVSVDIYEAVINHEVLDIDGFKQYLAKSGRTL